MLAPAAAGREAMERMRRPAITAHPEGKLLGIGKAAAECGVSERALRYYEEIGLLTPAGATPGGMRRYSDADLSRVRRIRELQSLLGFNLDEIRAVLASDDRLAAIRAEYNATSEGSARRAQLLRQALKVREDLTETVDAKIAALQSFRADLAASMDRVRSLLSGR
jgi:DNA-binding transcriptional MerR regulator